MSTILLGRVKGTVLSYSDGWSGWQNNETGVYRNIVAFFFLFLLQRIF
jgi:hypothetical protein